jgi:hypothetical protein
LERLDIGEAGLVGVDRAVARCGGIDQATIDDRDMTGAGPDGIVALGMDRAGRGILDDDIRTRR